MYKCIYLWARLRIPYSLNTPQQCGPGWKQDSHTMKQKQMISNKTSNPTFKF